MKKASRMNRCWTIAWVVGCVAIWNGQPTLAQNVGTDAPSAGVSTPAPLAAPAQTQPTPAPASAQPTDLEAQIQAVLKTASTSEPAEIVRTLGDLLQRDPSKVSVSVKATAYAVLANANERLAQSARENRLDPASERNAQRFIDAAVGNYIKSSQIFVEGSDFTNAELILNQVMKLRPKHPDALLGLARVNAATNRSLQAVEYFRDYFNATSKASGGVYESSLYIEFGRACLNASLWNQALKAFKDAEKSGGGSDELSSLMADAYLGLKKPDLALEEIKKAIARAPYKPQPYSRLAQMLLTKKSYQEAFEAASKSIQIARARMQKEPDNVGNLQEMLTSYDEFIRVCSTILGSDPTQLQVRLMLAQLMQEQASLRQLMTQHQVLGLLRTAPQQDRQNVQLLEKQVILEMTVHYRDVRKTCEALLKLDPNNKVAKEALAALESALATAPAVPSTAPAAPLTTPVIPPTAPVAPATAPATTPAAPSAPLVIPTEPAEPKTEPQVP